jgi:hypothetical protein
MAIEFQAALLRAIGEQCGLPPTRQVAAGPGVRAAYRLTIRYHDRRAVDSVATLRRNRADDAVLEVVYRGLFNHKPLNFQVDQTRYAAWIAALEKLRYDSLPDQPNLPAHGFDLWMLERASGSFVKSIVLAPERAVNEYAALARACEVHLPEALRPLQY